ncbi:hypothetical protein FRC96_19010 [Lujinxingia vulgaris]|uniref:DUF4177 domain-containing protein n=1 Tax=Lujinxingia vulgaris TaxID=2600176 RepID=A0A5C6X667_9DELT|nr:hypothetical protein [Lujinxingia vulgaris]TXD32086.1 hypothetical protein FRC96_19010 [Lujinxingia vulgaris]
MRWQYHPVPFEATHELKKTFEQAAAEQFSRLLNQMADQGWEYYRMDHYSVRENPGCLAIFSGSSPTVKTFDVAIFRRPSPGQ